MHLFDVSRGFMGGYAIVGGQLPIATGLGLAIKQQDGEGVVLCFFGDGAVNQGEFHEALNMASLWKLPVLFILENNLYGMGTHVDRTHAAGRDMYSMADAYKIPSAQIDGMDLETVREAVGEASGASGRAAAPSSWRQWRTGSAAIRWPTRPRTGIRPRSTSGV